MTRCILWKHGLGNSYYSDRLSFLKVESLERRRLLADLVFLFKILHGYVDLDAKDFFHFFDHKYETRGCNFNVCTKFVGRLEVDNNFFTHRVTRYWNALPVEVKRCVTIGSFRTMLAKFDFSGPAFMTKLRDFP